MNVIHICHSDSTGGGIRAAFDIMEGQRLAGIDARMLVGQVFGPATDHVRQLQADRSLRGRAVHWLRQRRRAKAMAPYANTFRWTCGDFTVSEAGLGAEIAAQVGTPDLIHLHWSGDLLNMGTVVPALAPIAPLVWTPQDVETLSGGCSVSLDCHGYLHRCGNCPELGSTRENDLSRRNWLVKHRGLSLVPESRLQMVGISTWMQERLQTSSLFKRFPCELISSSVDQERFSPGSVAEARHALGIPASARVVLFVTSHVNIVTKGFTYLREALDQLRDVPDLYLLSVGKAGPELPDTYQHQHLGLVRDDRTLAHAYRAATVFANPTIWETFGLTTVEAMACGTPVVGFDTTGLRDTIDHGVTGLRVPSKDVAALAGGLRQVLMDPELRASMSTASLARVEARFTRAIQTKRYLDLYRRHLASN